VIFRPPRAADRADAAGPTLDEEYADFVAAVSPTLLQVAWLLTGDHGRAEELVQAGLVRLYPAWPRIRDGDPLAYARRIIVNARIDHWRRLGAEELVDDIPERGGLDAAQAGIEDRDELRRALLALSPRERRIVVLRYYCDLPLSQIALDLHVSTGTVKSTASRALAKLRVAFEQSHRLTPKGQS
jgi:RNA polymerase sigma-70 factor (sigma-E family)